MLCIQFQMGWDKFMLFLTSVHSEALNYIIRQFNFRLSMQLESSVYTVQCTSAYFKLLKYTINLDLNFAGLHMCSDVWVVNVA